MKEDVINGPPDKMNDKKDAQDILRLMVMSMGIVAVIAAGFKLYMDVPDHWIPKTMDPYAIAWFGVAMIALTEKRRK